MKKTGGFVPIIFVILIPLILVSGYLIYQSMQSNSDGEPSGELITDYNQKTEPSSAQVSVTIDANSVSPAVVTVAKGTRVVFNNSDIKTHTLISSQLEFDPEESLGPGDLMSYAFDDAGTFVYYDKGNASLRGTVVVK